MKDAGFTSTTSDSSSTLSLYGLALFLAIVSANATYRFRPLFLAHHGWSHRLAGGALLTWLVIGTWNALMMQGEMPDAAGTSSLFMWLGYDTILGILGIITTLTAARDFPHKFVKNAQGQSGSLSQKALVTQAEMIEHSFYQGLNLLQAWYLYVVSTWHQPDGSTDWKLVRALKPLVLLWIVTCPWLIRCYWPVHSFSHNWKVTPMAQRTNQEVLLYQIKKSQYLFYKHVLLHGLNIYMALKATERSFSVDESLDSNKNIIKKMVTVTMRWRIYWLALNTSYVMEFFLQTLVRRKLLSLKAMFLLQQLLMGVSSVAALQVLLQLMMVPDKMDDNHSLNMTMPSICLVSLVLNFTNRHHDVLNVMMTAIMFLGLQQM